MTDKQNHAQNRARLKRCSICFELFNHNRTGRSEVMSAKHSAGVNHPIVRLQIRYW